MSTRWRFVIGNAALAAVYFGAAKLGLSLAIVHQNTTAVWPPTGIAIAALILWGFRLWPGVLIGALAANETTNFNVMSASGIAIGNTLEAVAGAWMVNHFAGGRRVFESAANIFKFVVLISLLSTTISATVGALTLVLSGSANWLTFWPIWLTWWLGDTAGALTVAPLLVVWIAQPLPRLRKREALEAMCLLAVTILSALSIFSSLSPLAMSKYPLAFLNIPALMWASYRFGQRGTTLSILILGSVAVLGAAKGIGPFYSVKDPNHALLLLQAFFGTITVAMLVLAAVVNQQQRAAEELRESESDFRRIANFTPQVVWTASPDGAITFANDRWYAYTGLTLEQTALGWPRLVLHPDDYDRCLTMWGSALRDGTEYEIEVRNRRHDGEYRWWLTRATPIRDASGRVNSWFGSSADIHDMKMAQQALAESEDRLGRSLRAANVVAWELDLPTGRLVHSDNCRDVLGIEPVDDSGAAERFLERVHQDDQPMVRREIDLALEGGSPEYELSFRFVRPDGSTIWLAHQAKIDRDASGTPQRMRGMIRDISSQTIAEQELARYRDHLEELVQQRTDELEQAHQRLRLSERMAAMGTLAAGIGHDMGNLLLPIRMRLDALKAIDSDDDVREHVAAIAQCAVYLQSLTNGLRLFAQDPDHRDINASTDLAKWQREVQALYKGVLPIRITLVWDVPDDLPHVAIAPHALTQAILNLINNAKDAIGRDGGGQVSIHASADSQAVALTVQDDGPGMQDEVRSRALEPFFTTKPRRLSTGLGLSLVHGIMNSARGHVEIVSPVDGGRGTAVTLRIPIAGDGEATRQRESQNLVCISLPDPRLSAMLTSLVRAMDCTVETSSAAPSHDCRLWITPAEPDRLETAMRFMANGSQRALLVVGEAPPSWRELATGTLPDACKMSDMRAIIARALRPNEPNSRSTIPVTVTEPAPT